MKKKPLSPREQECYDVVVMYYKKYKVFPTQETISAVMGVNFRQQVGKMLQTIAGKGWIKKTARPGIYLL
jgi:Mn-dependent DtxR family transcriptional regulator